MLPTLQKEFTFQYVSILIVSYSLDDTGANKFTFQYVSILIEDYYILRPDGLNLHSNMFLF